MQFSDELQFCWTKLLRLNLGYEILMRGRVKYYFRRGNCVKDLHSEMSMLLKDPTRVPSHAAFIFLFH